MGFSCCFYTWADFSRLQNGIDNGYFLAWWFLEALQTVPNEQIDALWEVDMEWGLGGGDWEAFLPTGEDGWVAVLSAAIWEELLQRLIPSCALVNGFTIFF